MLRQLLRFGGVGMTALVLHWCVVLLLVPFGMAPLVANVFAFLLAFQVSYFGHRILTFGAQAIPHRQTFPRFASVAGLSFLVNESLYAILLTWTPLGYQWALLLVLALVAALTFVLSRYWAFAA
ncbi:GtrA family protein [Nitrincola tapanii]|uniref:GtrA family protein n=1 Tax=Nitrincola tapanii TaxID=1708751 RepID=A0A5A9W1A4_9GAMM|nr:GtrA family protein [Nitrincola tapanii]KAA0874352.1 GtrA family protein [Nitrincola tapanii]